jgi:hypothetical protein
MLPSFASMVRTHAFPLIHQPSEKVELGYALQEDKPEDAAIAGVGVLRR